MFCLTDLEGDLSVSLKNDPGKNIELREEYTAIRPGYHLNKKHWITIDLNGTIPDDMVKNLVDESYDLVTMVLPKKVQQEIKKL